MNNDGACQDNKIGNHLVSSGFATLQQCLQTVYEGKWLADFAMHFVSNSPPSLIRKHALCMFVVTALGLGRSGAA